MSSPLRRSSFVRAAVTLAAVGAALPAIAGASTPGTASGNCSPTVAYRAGAGGSTPAASRVCIGTIDAASGEPTVGVTRDGTVVYYPANLKHPGTTYTRADLAVSHDGGSSFTNDPITLAGTVPLHEVDLDPYMYVDPHTSRIFVESNTTGNCDQLSTSDDDGATWSTHTIDGCVTFDHENLFAGPPPPGGRQPAGYPDVVYRCSYGGGAFSTFHTNDSCEKSLDGGLVWTPTGTPAFLYDPRTFQADPDVSTTPYGCMDQLGHGVVAPDGTIYLPAGMCGVPEIAVSHDEGRTWTHSVVSRNLPLHEFSNGVTVNDTAVAVDRTGRLYALWIARNTLPYVATSTDGGRTWSRPVMVAPPGVDSTVLPEIIAGQHGRIAIAFMGSTNAPSSPPYVPCPRNVSGCVSEIQGDIDQQEVVGNPAFANTLWNGYLLVSPDPSAPHPAFVGGPVSSAPFVRGSCGPDSCQEEKDFIDVRFGPDGTAYASYVDACSQTCATQAGGSDDINDGIVARLNPR